MAIKESQNLSVYNRKYYNDSLLIKETKQWTRNPSWLQLPTITTSDSKFAGLVAIYKHAVNEESTNFLSISASINFTVDWGDGSPTENFNNTAVAYHTYDFNNANLANTDAPVTLTDSGDLIQRTAHGYTNGMTVQFYNIVSTTGIIEGQIYYVVNANTNDFQVSSTEGGSPVTLTNNGSATLLDYKQAIVTLTPQAGSKLTSIYLNNKHPQAGLATYVSPWLDLKYGSPDLTSIGLSALSLVVRHYKIEQVEIVKASSVNNLSYAFASFASLKKVIFGDVTFSNVLNNCSYMFYNCFDLISVPIFDTSTVTSMQSMFDGCRKITSIPSYDTKNLSNASSMFGNCFNLTEIPKLNTSKVTDMSLMFRNCYSLESMVLLDTSSVTNMNAMFQYCVNLKTIPAFNTSNVTNTSSMFNFCYALESVPLLDLSKVTNMSNMFQNCYKLKSIPPFDVSSATNMLGLFNACASLQTVPFLNTSNVQTMSTMFQGCYCIQDIPFFNTSNVTNMSGMFNNCRSLKKIPQFDTSKVTNMSNMFANTGIEFVTFLDTSKVTNVNSMFQTCTRLTSVPKFDLTSVTNAQGMFSSCLTLKSIPLFNFNNVSLGMNNMFSSCRSLAYVPGLNLSSLPATSLTDMFVNCGNLSSILASGARYTHSIANCKLSKTSLKKYMDNLGTVASAGQTLTISGNWGSGAYSIKTVTSTAQSTTITCANTSVLSTGMMMTGSGTGLTTGINVTSDVTADTLSFTSHGLASGTRMSFANSGTTGGVVLSGIYYPVNINPNDFQISTAVSGAAINLTGTNSAMNLRYGSYITAINPNVDITLDVPAASGITNGSWTFREVDAYGALLKGWSVIF